MAAIERAEILRRLRENIDKGIPIIGTGAGTGISAKFEEAGRGSCAGVLAYGDANAIVMDMANEVLPVVKNTPVLAGVNGTDPFKDMYLFLKQVKERGFSGVQNFPTVGLLEGRFRANLEETGMGYDKEVEMVRIAHEMDLLTTPYAFNVEEAKEMTRAGADIIVAHCGTTIGGTIGADSVVTLDDAAKLVQDIHDAAVSVNPDVIVLCHGGPISGPEDAQYILRHTTGVHGFYGASSAERMPTEVAITEHTRKFKSISFK